MIERATAYRPVSRRRPAGAAPSASRLPADASFRRYVRLYGPEKRRALLMDAPPPQENVRPFSRWRGCCAAWAWARPPSSTRTPRTGLLLIEDFGDDTYTRLLAQGEAEEPLYALAVDVLIALGAALQAQGSVRSCRLTTTSGCLTEAALLVDWYLPAVTGKPADARLARGISRPLARAAAAGARRAGDAGAARLSRRQSDARRRAAPGSLACGLLDFQDAVLGPQSYDLVSLLEDARRDVAPGSGRDA